MKQINNLFAKSLKIHKAYAKQTRSINLRRGTNEFQSNKKQYGL